MLRSGRTPAVAASLLVLASATSCGGPSKAETALDVFVPEPEDAGTDAAELQAEGGPEPIDRAAHPLVAVLLVPGSLEDSYNAQPSFASSLPRIFQDAIEARLVAFDTLTVGDAGDAGPDPVDWPIPDGGTHPLLPAFATDVLLVDTALSCAGPDGGFASSYLDLDREVYLGGPTHTTCGGRTPAEDVVTKTLTLLVTAGRAPVSQGVPGPTKPVSRSFPYLAPAN